MKYKNDKSYEGIFFYPLNTMHSKYQGMAMGGEIMDKTVKQIKEYLLKGSSRLYTTRYVDKLTIDALFELKASSFGFMVGVSDCGEACLIGEDITPLKLLTAYNKACEELIREKNKKQIPIISLTEYITRGNQLNKDQKLSLYSCMITNIRDKDKKEKYWVIVDIEVDNLIKVANRMPILKPKPFDCFNIVGNKVVYVGTEKLSVGMKELRKTIENMYSMMTLK